MSLRPRMFIKDIKDPVVRKNMELLLDFVNGNTPFAGFKFHEFTVDGAKTDYRFKHNLGYIPTDIVQLYITDGVTATWKHDSFDKDFLILDTDGAATIRFLVGRMDPTP